MLKKGGSVLNLHSVFFSAVCLSRCWFALILFKGWFLPAQTKCIQVMYEHCVCACVFICLFVCTFARQLWHAISRLKVKLPESCNLRTPNSDSEWFAEFIPSGPARRQRPLTGQKQRKITLISTFIRSAKCFFLLLLYPINRLWLCLCSSLWLCVYCPCRCINTDLKPPFECKLNNWRFTQSSLTIGFSDCVFSAWSRVSRLQ